MEWDKDPPVVVFEVDFDGCEDSMCTKSGSAVANLVANLVLKIVLKIVLVVVLGTLTVASRFLVIMVVKV